MLQAAVEHLTQDPSFRSIVHPFSQLPGTMILLVNGSETDAARWQVELDMLQPTSMPELYAQLEQLVANSQQQGQEIKFVTVVLFAERVFLAGYQLGMRLVRQEHEKILISAQESIQVLEGNYHPGDQYIVDSLAQISFLDLAAPTATQQKAQQAAAQIQQNASKFRTAGFSLLQLVKQIAMQNGQWLLEGWRRLSKRQQVIALGILAALMVLLFGGTGFWQWQKGRAQQQSQQIVAPLKEQFASIQRQPTENPAQAKQVTQAFLDQVSQASENKQLLSATRSELSALRNAVTAYMEGLSSQELPALPIFFDLRLLQSDLLGNRIAVTNQSLFVLDSSPKKVVSIDIPSKNAKFVPTGELKTITDIAVNTSSLYFLGEGIAQASVKDDAPPTAVALSPEKLSGELLRFYNDNLYVFDRANRDIWRVSLPTSDEKKSAEVQNWVKNGQFVEYDAVNSMAVDGNVWLGMKDGKVLKFSAGRAEDFTLANVAQQPNSPVLIYTDDSVQNIYIIEPQQSRLLIAEKSGNVLREIRSSTFASASSLVASEANKKVFVLSGSLIFEVNM